MKKTAYILAFALTLGSFALHAQTDTTQTTYTYVTAKEDLTAKFLPMPDPLTMEKIFPATGNFQLTQTNIEGATEINIMLDSANKGLVWIEGLPMGKIKAQLRQSPATYKIPAQKTEDGKSIEEGTLVYDKEANILNICLGCTYDETEPAKPFTIATETMDSEATTKKVTKKTSSSKAKVWNYTGAKLIVEEEVTTDEMENPQQKEENKEMKKEQKEEQKEEKEEIEQK
ncbi:MAG: hypothetical protein H0V30_01935 [Chitinophagaceae bacterium]|nr:hypothetical protein [Chitinophagaceae bacterium]